jgi:hypothetical protein
MNGCNHIPTKVVHDALFTQSVIRLIFFLSLLEANYFNFNKIPLS